jgi:hypothetical protein
MLQHPFADIDDFVAGMAVLGPRPGSTPDARLGDLASRDAPLVLLDVGALECGLRRLSYRGLLSSSNRHAAISVRTEAT